MKSKFDPLSVAAMTVTVVSISATAPLTAAASAPALAMAFWRNALGFAVLGPLLLVLRRHEYPRVVRGERGVLRRKQWRPMVFGFLDRRRRSVSSSCWRPPWPRSPHGGC